MIDLKAIRARDALWMPRSMRNKSVGAFGPFGEQELQDRRALLAYLDELREAAGKVTCERCNGVGTHVSPMTPFSRVRCDDCADLRRLLGEKT